MKAAEVLRLYKAGERDFKGANLRGQNFKGKDLSGADFRGADIRSTNFTNANLKGTNFTQAKAGLQKRWAIGLVVISFLLSGFSGSFLAFAGAFVSLIFDSSGLEYQVSGWVSLAVVVVFLFLLLRKGVETVFVALAGIMVVAVAGALSVAVVGMIAGTIAASLVGPVSVAVALAVSVTGTVAVAVAVALSGAVVGIVAVAVAGTIAVAVAGTIAIAIAIAIAGTIAIAVAVALVVTLLSSYVGWRALKGDKRDTWIRSVAISFAAIGGTSFRGATLTDADFSHARLKSSDFRRSVLLRTRWREAEKLDRVRPGDTYLNNSKIRELVLTGNGQGQSYDHLLNLAGLNLQGANLVKADFTGSNLKDGALQGANLANASFNGANLNCAYLQDADLSNATLAQAQLDEADLTGTTLTGACIEDWGITTRTNLNGIRCDYVFMRLLSDRRQDQNPHRKPDDWDKTFADGEFVDFIAPMVETLDLYHNQVLDPRALAISFHELRENNPDADLEIVSMEKRGKQRDQLLVRAEASQQSDLSALHRQYFERYDYLLTLPPQAMQALLIEKDREVHRLASLVGTAIDRPSTQINKTYQGDTTVSEQGSNAPKYDLSNAQFAGGFAETVQGDQIGGTINNYGPNTEDITRLLAALRDQAQAFPADPKDEANDALDDLERDLAEEQPDQGRIGRRLKKLIALGAAIGTIASGAAAVSGDISTFTGNVIELTEKLGIPIEQVQLE